MERSDETDDEVVPEFVSFAEGCFSSVDDVMAASDGRQMLVGREGLIEVNRRSSEQPALDNCRKYEHAIRNHCHSSLSGLSGNQVREVG